MELPILGYCSERFSISRWFLGFGALSLLALTASAQGPAQPAQDPLITLMLSQPKIEISGPVFASTGFDPPEVRPGELSIYRVTFNALEQSIEWPAEMKAPANLEMRAGAHGQILELKGFGQEPRTTFNYRVRAPVAGEFTVPGFVVSVYGKPVEVPAARLAVVAGFPPARPVQQLLLEIPETNLFVGQAATARVLLRSGAGGFIQGLAQVQLNGPGVIVDQGMARQRYEPSARDGANVPTFIHETMLTPIAAGKVSVSAQGFTGGHRFSGPITIIGPASLVASPPQYVLLESDPVELEVLPLPREGALPGFTGAIGNFALEPPRLATNVARVGEPVKLSVTVTERGHGNLGRLVPPPPPSAPDWQVFAPTIEGTPQQIQQQARATFVYTMIALDKAASATPVIPFSYFDPQRGSYVDLTIPSIPIQLQPAASPADLRALMQKGSDDVERETEPVLSGLATSPGWTAGSLVPVQQKAWFLAGQLLPASAFVGLWGWERRRRFLEQHPDVVLRRRARRALRRERRALREAARAGDAPGFAVAGANAMRVACAPHYPAEPRALVGGDVLQVLRESNGAAGSERVTAVVRRFFAVTDASRFAMASGDATELLALEPELERVLERLEARL